MTTSRIASRSPVRGTLSTKDPGRHPALALIVLGLIGVLQSGCKSDGCSTCGGFFSRTANKVGDDFQALGAKVFNHGSKTQGCSTCGGGDGGYVEQGIPIVAPGGMVVPGPVPVMPSVAPSSPIEGPQLEAIPSSSTQPAPPGGTGTGGSGSATKSSSFSRNIPGNIRSAYEVSSPRASTPRGRVKAGEIARANLPGAEQVSLPVMIGPGSSDLLDLVPPVDSPTDAKPSTSPGGESKLDAETSKQSARPDPPASHGEMLANLPTPLVIASKVTPGILRWAPLAPSIGGGSAPSADGLAWLKEKGYKTFIDLRPRKEIDPSFSDAVNDANMVYISLPIEKSKISSVRLARFDDLVTQAANRPIYFCDRDGSVAGLVWYLHLRTKLGESDDSAAQKVEDLGFDPELKGIADRFLDEKPAEPRTADRRPIVSVTSPSADHDPAVAAPADQATPPASNTPPILPTPEPPLELPDSPPQPMLPPEIKLQASLESSRLDPGSFRDPSTWKAVAAFVLTGFGVPLAYWSKTAISGSRGVRRASLPGAERRSLSGPARSDA